VAELDPRRPPLFWVSSFGLLGGRGLSFPVPGGHEGADVVPGSGAGVRIEGEHGAGLNPGPWHVAVALLGGRG
jgi:hypothetical protein